MLFVVSSSTMLHIFCELVSVGFPANQNPIHNWRLGELPYTFVNTCPPSLAPARPHIQTELSGRVAVGRATLFGPTGDGLILANVIYPDVHILYCVTGPPLKLNVNGIVCTGVYCNV